MGEIVLIAVVGAIAILAIVAIAIHDWTTPTHPITGLRWENGPTCKYCGKNSWTWIPDSLARACECGAVIVGTGNDVEYGASMQQWLNDVYQIPYEDLKPVPYPPRSQERATDIDAEK